MPHENPYNTPEVLEAHLKRTGGQVRTRFPPEPNVRLLAVTVIIVIDIVRCT